MTEDRCPACNKAFDNKEELDRHMNEIHSELSETYLSKEFLMEVPHDCPMCGQELDPTQPYTDHMMNAHGIVGTMADIGGEPTSPEDSEMINGAFSNGDDEEISTEEDEDEEEFLNGEDEEYSDAYDLENNYLSEDYDSLECDQCNLSFDNRDELNTHKNDVHADALEFFLDEDNRFFEGGVKLPSHENDKDDTTAGDIIDSEHDMLDAGIPEDSAHDILKKLGGETFAFEFDEKDHPRGQPGNPGQFAPKDGGSSGSGASDDRWKKYEYAGKKFIDHDTKTLQSLKGSLQSMIGSDMGGSDALKKDKIDAIQSLLDKRDEKQKNTPPSEIPTRPPTPRKEPKPTKKSKSKHFNKAKDQALNYLKKKAIKYSENGHEPSWLKDDIQKLENMDGFPTNSKDIRGLDTTVKAKLAKTHVQSEYPSTNFSVKTDRYSGGSSFTVNYTGGKYPYGANKIVDVYSDEGQTDIQTDYFDVDNYAFMHDDRPYSDRGYDPQTIANTREERFANWVGAYLRENGKHQESYSMNGLIAKDLLSNDKTAGWGSVDREDMEPLLKEFREQERKENAGESFNPFLNAVHEGLGLEHYDDEGTFWFTTDNGKRVGVKKGQNLEDALSDAGIPSDGEDDSDVSASDLARNEQNDGDIEEPKGKNEPGEPEEDEDAEFERSHGMEPGQVKKNRIQGIKDQYELLTDENQEKFDQMLEGKSLEDMSNQELRDLNLEIGGMERDDDKILGNIDKREQEDGITGADDLLRKSIQQNKEDSEQPEEGGLDEEESSSWEDHGIDPDVKEKLTELVGEDDVEVEDVYDSDPGGSGSGKMISLSNGQEWSVYDTEDDAIDAVKERVQNDLDDGDLGPYAGFNEDFARNYVEMSEVDKNLWVQDMASSYRDDLEYENDQRDDDDPDKLTDEEIEEKEEEYRNDLEEQMEDPLQYIEDNFGEEEVNRMIEQGTLRVDVDRMVDDAIASDGLGHFISGYDGEYQETSDGKILARHN